MFFVISEARTQMSSVFGKFSFEETTRQCVYMCVHVFMCACLTFPHSILTALPTAELEPLTDGQVSQTDEVRGPSGHLIAEL